MAEFDLGTYGAKLELDDSQFNKSMSNAEKGLKNTGSKTDGFGKKAAKVAGGAVLGLTGAIAGIGAAGFAMAEKVTGAFDDISKGAQRVGVSTDFYQELDFWASQNGMSHDKMEKAIGRFNQRLGLAMDGSDKYASALDRMGVNLDDVRNGTLSTEDAFAQSIQSLSEMENQQEQVALATELFGTRLARDMLPSLQDGALSLDDARKKAQELGLVIGEDSLAAGVAFQDTWDQLKRSMTTAGQQIMGQLMPIFQSLMDWVIAHMPQIQAIFQTAFSVVQTVFTGVVTVIQTVIGWFQNFFTTNQDTMNGIWETIQTVFGNVVSFLQETWQYLVDLWNEYGQQLVDFYITYLSLIWDTVKLYISYVYDIFKNILNKIVPFVKEKLKMITDFWDENGEQIMEAVRNAFEFVQGLIEKVMPIISGIIETAWKFISTTINTAVGIILGIVKTFASLLTGDFEGVKIGITKIWDSLWGGIKGIFSDAWVVIMSGVNVFKDKFLGVWDNIKTGIKNIVNPIIGFINALIGGMESMVNAVASAVNKLPTFQIPDWVPGIGGGTFGLPHIPSVNLPKIPSLATGGVVKTPTLAMVGDAGRNNPEIVAPHKMLSEIFQDALKNHGSNNQDTYNMPITMNFEVNGNIDEMKAKEISKSLFKHIDQQMYKRGMEGMRIYKRKMYT